MFCVNDAENIADCLKELLSYPFMQCIISLAHSSFVWPCELFTSAIFLH